MGITPRCMLQGGWFVYSSSPALSDNPNLPPGSEQVARGVACCDAASLVAWVLASLSCRHLFIPAKAPQSLDGGGAGSLRLVC